MGSRLQRLSLVSSVLDASFGLVQRYGVAFSERLREILSGSSVRRDKLDAIAAGIVGAKDSKAQWVAVLADLEALALFAIVRDGAEKRPRRLP
jgi:hypothetical protein